MSLRYQSFDVDRPGKDVDEARGLISGSETNRTHDFKVQVELDTKLDRAKVPHGLRRISPKVLLITVLTLVAFGMVLGIWKALQPRSLGYLLAPSSDTCSDELPKDDCGYYGIKQEECQERGCCWKPAGGHGNVPWCFYPNGEVLSYKVYSRVDTATGVQALLRLAQPQLPWFGVDTPWLLVQVEQQTRERLHVKISPANASRYEVPELIIPRPSNPPSTPSDPLYRIDIPPPGEDFSLVVTRASSGEAVFNSSGSRLVFKPQLLELSTRLPPSAALYGMGEVTLESGIELPRDGRVITLWNTDTFAGDTGLNIYGSHPFYLDVRQGGTAHGVFLLNSNGMDVMLNDKSLTYRVIGGLLDLYFLLGPHPEAVARQYHEVIGRPAMPPRWALGYHQCRWGYPNLQALRDVVSGHQAAGLPLEVMWSDIDYMDQARIFTFDPDNFPVQGMREWVESLHASHQHWVPIMDCGLTAADDYPPYQEAVARGLVIRDRNGDPFLGEVWSGPTVWPDFLNPQTWGFWQEHIRRMYEMVPFDGLWLDMNEVSNFCPGDVCRHAPSLLASVDIFTRCTITCREAPKTDPLAFPPYPINNQARQAALGFKTVAPTARHGNGMRWYDTHNTYPVGENAATHAALANITARRPFLLTRSTFPGVGRYAAHWTGDNRASWDNLRYSVAGMINSNIWGVPLAGADICGFSGATNEELCARWLSAGAFYTFVRNHNQKGDPDQEAFRWQATTTAAAKALGLRYRLLPYLYSSFLMAHRQGGTVARPLLFAQPSDPALRALASQWMLGDWLMVAPVLQQGAADVEVYFPVGEWYSAWDMRRVAGPQRLRVPAPLGDVPVYLRAGGILPMQESSTTTHATSLSPVTLLVTLPSHQSKERLAACTAASSSASSGSSAGPCPPETSTQAYLQARMPRHNSNATAAGGSSWGDGDEQPDAVGLLYSDDGVALEVGRPGLSCETWFAAWVTGPAMASGRLVATPGSCEDGSTAGPTSGVDGDMVRPQIHSVVVLGVVVPAGQHLQVQLGEVLLPDAQVVYDSSLLHMTLSGLALRQGQAFVLEWGTVVS